MMESKGFDSCYEFMLRRQHAFFHSDIQWNGFSVTNKTNRVTVTFTGNGNAQNLSK